MSMTAPTISGGVHHLPGLPAPVAGASYSALAEAVLAQRGARAAGRDPGPAPDRREGGKNTGGAGARLA